MILAECASGPYPWQQQEWRQIVNLVDQDRLPHGLLLAGPAEIGKRQFAFATAQLLLCSSPVADWACGQCKSCKLFAASSHPDFLGVEPEEDGKAIKVDQIRALAEFATRTSAMGGKRVIIVSPADAMNLNAANAFLKTLEEPGKEITLILVAHQLGRMLPTIRSRCRIFPFALPDRAVVAAWLVEKQVNLDDVDEAIQLSGGRPLRGLRLLQTELWEQLQLFRQTLAAVSAGTESVLDAAKVLQGMAKTDVLEWFQYQAYGTVKNSVIATQGNPVLLFRFLDRLNSARQRLLSTANPNPQLVWEEVLMDWKSVLDLQQAG